jgi:signal transduction histidine kinase
MDYGLEELKMSRIFYIGLLILSFSVSCYQTIWFGVLCAVVTFFIMLVLCHVRLRKVARAIRARFAARLAQRTLVARELHDTMLQTVQGSKFIVDDALEKSDDPDHMRLTLEKLSGWLGQATQEGQEALNSLPTAPEEERDV